MILETARHVLETEARTLARLAECLDNQFERAVELIFACQGCVIVAGMGKSGIIAQKISATLSSTGTPSYFLHPAEALHGDLGRLVSGDALLALSYTGETADRAFIRQAAESFSCSFVAGEVKKILWGEHYPYRCHISSQVFVLLGLDP